MEERIIFDNLSKFAKFIIDMVEEFLKTHPEYKKIFRTELAGILEDESQHPIE